MDRARRRAEGLGEVDASPRRGGPRRARRAARATLVAIAARPWLDRRTPRHDAVSTNLGRCAARRADRPVHVADPVARGLGAGPVDPATGSRRDAAVGDERSGRREADRAAARPASRRPVRLEVARSGSGRRAPKYLVKFASTAACRAAGIFAMKSRARSPPTNPKMMPARSHRRRRGVVGHLHRPFVGDRRAVQPGFAPERRRRRRTSTFISVPCEIRCVSWSRRRRQDGRVLDPRRRAPAGSRRSPAWPSPSCPSRTPSRPPPLCLIRLTGARLITRLPSAFAIRSQIRPEPPLKRNILGPVASVEVALEGADVLLVARGGDVEEDVEQRQLARLGAEDRPGRDRDDARELLRDRVVLDP